MQPFWEGFLTVNILLFILLMFCHNMNFLSQTNKIAIKSQKKKQISFLISTSVLTTGTMKKIYCN
jgi:hypothetical protein